MFHTNPAVSVVHPAAGYKHFLPVNAARFTNLSTLLVRQFVLSNYNQKSQDSYAPCYKCHNPVKGRGPHGALRPHPIILTKSVNFFPV